MDHKSASSDIVRFNNAGGMRFYGDLDMNSNNITSAGTITSTAGISTTTLTTSDKITTASGKPIIIGNTTKSANGATGGLELYGTVSNIGGAHLQAITTAMLMWINTARVCRC